MSFEEQIHKWMIKNQKTLCLAESCTGGHLAARFSSIADASQYFLGSLVTYSNYLKQAVLKVSNSTLLENGAVSRATANEMLLGLMKLSDADFGIAVTGIAGPTGGTKEKPVGTVFAAMGIAHKKPHVFEYHFAGSRKQVIESSCDRILSDLLSILHTP